MCHKTHIKMWYRWKWWRCGYDGAIRSGFECDVRGKWEAIGHFG